jgi:hypothetical protein
MTIRGGGRDGLTGPSTTVTGQAGKQRTTTADALGRITKVVEDPGSPVCSASVPQPCTTIYGYDARIRLGALGLARVWAM